LNLRAGCVRDESVARGRNIVPTYQYRCEDCQETFERTETMAEHDAAKPQCPKCGSTKVSVVPGRIYVVTSKKS
jgi:putative FmdB family regulatory protein